MPKAVSVSLDQIMSQRAFSVRRTSQGAEALTKVYKSPPTWKQDTRSARFVMTAQITDRYGDIVVSKGGDLTSFTKAPVALWAHNSRGFPIGQWDNIKVVVGTPKRMEGDCVINPEGTTDESDTVAKLIACGSVRACSIGFMPMAWESIKDEKDRTTGYQFNEWELLECSPCSVPANPAAIVKAAGGDEGLAMQAIELVLDEWAMTPEGIIVPREKFIAAYNFVRNKDVTIHEVRAIEEDDAPEVEVNPLDIEAAVGRGLEKVADGLFAKFMAQFAKAKELPAPPVTTEPAPAAVVENQTPEDDGETEEQFQARLAADKAAAEAAATDEADEALEAELRARASA
jgi:HK97 family phage prohead protease